MREIKFRAWDEENKKMYCGDEIERLTTDRKMFASLSYGALFIAVQDPDWRELEVMQFTGLLDRNGVEIYEGDIFPPTERTQGEVTIVCYDSKQGRYKAVPLSLYNANAGNGGWTGYDLNQFSEVIGNIYESKEE